MIRGTFNRTLYGTLLITACATVLTACGGSDGSDMPGNDANDSQRQSLLYAYPDDGQAEVPTKAPVVLRFTSDVSLGDVEQSVTLCCDAEGGNLDYTAETVGPDPRGVILTPAQSLSPLTDYTIAIKNLRLRNGTSADRTLRFTTRPLAEGPRSLVVKDDGFAIDRQMPNGDTNEPIMDFSSFRFQFTQPVDRASARYGDAVVLTDSSGETVEATLLINGHYMTVDPKPEYLTPGQSYTLSLTNGLTSTFDEAFAGTEINFTPADSSPRGEPAMLVQRITQSGLSRLTGKNINQVPVNGTLLGEDVNVTQASADAVVAELADVTEYPDVTPIRLPRGTKLTGSAIEMVMIGGEVPAGFGSGPVDMRLTSDATGYLVPNPYNVHNRADALRIVHLLMDVGIATEDPRANGGFTQDIMHIELVGVAEVDTEAGVLNLDAVGMVEPNILGQEYGHGLLSFQLQSYKDQMNAPTAPEDTTGPTLQSWTLGTDTITGEDKSLLAKPGDPIILNFDEPIDPQSVEGNVTLYKTVNGGAEEEMPAQVYVDGAAIVVKPEEDLVYSPEEAPVGYRLQLETATDIVGNAISSPIDNDFTLPTIVDKSQAAVSARVVIPPIYNSAPPSQDYAPMVISAYPGYPCALLQEYLDDKGEGEIDPSRDLKNNIAGRCAGGPEDLSQQPNASEIDKSVVADDFIPVSGLPSDRPIIIRFSKPIDAESVVFGKTFYVEKIDNNENVLENVQGKLEKNREDIVFYPDSNWEIGSLYRYRLASSGYRIGDLSGSVPGDRIYSDSNYTCGETAICDKSSTPLPLQTQPIGTTNITYIGDTGFQRNYDFIVTSSDVQAGGPDLVQFFRGEEKNRNTLQYLTTQPISDTNRNLVHDASNLGTSTNLEPLYGFPFFYSNGEYQYKTEEFGPTTESSELYPQYDPDGLSPEVNSAKVISRYQNDNLTSNIEQNPGSGIFGFNIGCSYNVTLNVFDQTPMKCPDHKFSYLISSIIAEVTDQVTENGIKVLIWPSMVIGTSLDVYALSGSNGSGFGIPGKTGIQILRMRYHDSGNFAAYRSEPITAWIKDVEGQPTLQAKLDLYVDIPYVAEWGIGAPQNPANMRSYPITMNLEGPVNFLDDGRMMVEQINTAPVDLTVRFWQRGTGRFNGYGDLFIPEKGSRLQYLSAPIK